MNLVALLIFFTLAFPIVMIKANWLFFCLAGGALVGLLEIVRRGPVRHCTQCRTRGTTYRGTDFVFILGAALIFFGISDIVSGIVIGKEVFDSLMSMLPSLAMSDEATPQPLTDSMQLASAIFSVGFFLLAAGVILLGVQKLRCGTCSFPYPVPVDSPAATT